MVAVGYALGGAAITVTDAAGKTTTATSGSDGSYTVSLAGLAPPLLITASDPSGASQNLYSVVASLGSNAGAPIIANITPLTTAVTALLTSDGNPLTLTQAGGLNSVSTASISTAVSTLDSAISPILSANGLASSFDPIGTVFTPNQTGADAVIDSVTVSPSASGTGLQLASLADPNTSIQLARGVAISTPLQAPSQPANFLSGLLGQLQQCVTGNASACSTAIDSAYLSNGGNSMQSNHPDLFASGTTLTGIKTIAFLPANTLANISNPSALVSLMYRTAGGTPETATEVVQELPGGNWDVIGDQEAYDLTITSFVSRLQFTDSADTANARLESGLDIQIPADIGAVIGGSGQQQIASALVQGPGLPSSGLYMLSPLSGTGAYLTIPATAMDAPYPLCSGCSTIAPNGGMNTTYKWSWSTLTGGASAWTPRGAAEYAPQPQDVSGIGQFSVYTVTLYDMTGAQIGQPQKVIDVASNAAAASGATVPWQTLGSSTIANLLTPGGASTSVTGNASATLNWTAPLKGTSYPNFWASINSLSAPSFSGNVLTFQSQPYGADNFAAPTLESDGISYAETFPQGFVDVLTATTSSSAEQSAQVQLNWQANGEHFRNIWQYNN